MNMLSCVERGRTPMPPRILVYGVEGVGKSTFASQSPKPVFVQTEDGLGQIDCHRFPLAASFKEVHRSLIALYTDEHAYETIVIDSLDWLERLIHADVCQKQGVENIEAIGYAKGYSFALTQWREVLTGLDALRNKRAMTVVLIAHSKIERFEDPESLSYDRFVPRLHKHAAAMVVEWADAVLFATRRFRVQSEDAGFNRKRGIAAPVGKGGGDRVLRCTGGPTAVAKNRFSLPDELPLSWSAFEAALSKDLVKGVTQNG